MGWRRKISALAAGVLLASGCSPDEPASIASRSGQPTPTPTKSGRTPLCQPFPDRLIDAFLSAYNSENALRLEGLVVDDEIEDAVATAYSGQESFDGVLEWAEAGWAVGDKMRSVGYSAFSPSKNGFQMMLSRRSEALREEGIDGVAMTLDADTKGCSITHLAMSGDLVAKTDPCAMYESFGDLPAVAATEPTACEDGSAEHARRDHAMVWTGGKALIWGGNRGGDFTWADVALDGLVFEPGDEGWSRIPVAPLPDMSPAVGAWTGSELIVLGGKTRPGYQSVGAAYEPATDRWRPLDFPYPKWDGFKGVWTGAELLLWGSPRVADPQQRGVAYSPATDSWRTLPRAPIGGRWWHSLVWTGAEMIVWGGSDESTDLADGAAYNPATDTWRKIAPAPISARQWLPLEWTGTEMIAWGGSSVSRPKADGAAYNPATDTWRKLARSPLDGRYNHSVTWTGSRLIVFGGYDYKRSYRDGAAYDPLADSWQKIKSAPIAPRFAHSAVWTGRRLFVFGGMEDFGHMSLGDGALYDPTRNRWTRLIPDPWGHQ